MIGPDDRNELESSIVVAIYSPTGSEVSSKGSEVSPKPDFCKPYTPADDSDSELRELRSNKPMEAIGDNDYSEQEEHCGYSTSSDEMIVTDGVDHVLTSSKTTKANSASSRDVLQTCLPAPGGNNDLKLFLMNLDSKDDRLRQERRLEEERREKRLEECHQQQMKAIQDKFAYNQEQLGKQKAKEEKASRNAEIWRMEDKRRREREQASKDIHAIPKMTALENIYNCIVRIERILIAKNIPKDMWAGALGQVFTGNALEQYSLHADTGNCEGLKYVLLQTCVFRLMTI